MIKHDDDIVIDRVIIDSKIGQGDDGVDLVMLASDGRAVRFGFGPVRAVVDFDANRRPNIGPTLTMTFEAPAFEISHCGGADVDPPSGIGGVGLPAEVLENDSIDRDPP